ncbi:dihydroneopterin aldolase [Dysgonomonas sp. 511]|uniref:dihydroneopterin aldolase n=1 Tax=Dysgonomonas sp. 511 TaxID=2302930 RepID=UPI0013D38F42|nr:dihydroneopterin aldolase [Dysgonomonas sp. 511]NDV77623.1 dihydroneopterin aldolase [Dysgonomonas sp. 511]
MESYILLENLKIFARHGVLPQETLVGNEYIVNLKLAVDLSKSCQTDNLDDTISYAEVYEIVKKEMEIPSKLLEHAAYRIICSLKNRYVEISKVEIKLSKRNPPMGAQMDYASIVLIK